MVQKIIPVAGHPSFPVDEPSAWLLQRAREGDIDALRELLSPYEALVKRLARRLASQPADAEDFAQDAFLRIIQSISAYKGRCPFRVWVYRIALNTCLTGRAKTRREGGDLESLEVEDRRPGPEELFLRGAFQGRVTEEIRRLPLVHREAVLLRVVEELPYEEVAEILEVSVNTARARVHRGMKRLRERLSEEVRG